MTFLNTNNATYNLQATYKGGLFVKSDVATWIKNQWATMVRREIEQDLLMRRFVMGITFPEGKYGDRVTIPTIGRLGVNTKIAGVPVNLQKTSPGTWQILIDQYKETSFMVEDIVELMLDPSGMLTSNLAKEAAYAINRDVDAFLLGQRAAINNVASQVVFSSSDNANGASSVSEPLTLDAFLRAKLIMDNADVPTEGRVLVVSPTQFSQLLALDKVQSMFYRTSAPLESGIVGTLLGVPVYMTSTIGANNSTTGFFNGYNQAGTTPISVATPGASAANTPYYPTQDTATPLPTAWANGSLTGSDALIHTAMMLHRDAIAMAMLQEPKTETSRETLYLADAVVTSTLYGAKLYRPNYAVLIHTNATLPSI